MIPNNVIFDSEHGSFKSFIARHWRRPTQWELDRYLEVY